MNDGEIVFVKYCQASRVKHVSTVTQDGERVLRVNQNVSADDCVDLSSRLPVLDIGLHALDVLNAFCGCTSLEGFERRIVKVHGGDRTVRADQTRREDGDVTDTATKIQNVHTRGDACTIEELLSKRIQHRRLKYETTAFAVIMTHHICGGVRHEPRVAGNRFNSLF